VAKATGQALRNFLRTHLLVASNMLLLGSSAETVTAGGRGAAGRGGGGGEGEGGLQAAPGGGAGGGHMKLVHPETEDHVAVACVVVERKGRLFDPVRQ
jgi:hypothetical protein